jgi:hypothetical protein
VGGKGFETEFTNDVGAGGWRGGYGGGISLLLVPRPKRSWYRDFTLIIYCFSYYYPVKYK